MLSIGNIMPESMMTGSMKTTAETISADNRVLAIAETRRPTESDRTI